MSFSGRPLRRRGASVVLVIAVVACGGTAEQPRAAARAGVERAEVARTPGGDSSPSRPGRRPSGTAGELEARAAQKAIDQSLDELQRVRGLGRAGPVRSEVLGRTEMAERVREQLEREVPAHVVVGSEELLIAFGVVPLNFDYMESLIALMGEELAGFYDPEAATMFLAAELEGDERRATLSHELVHALQDQHFDLGALLTHRSDGTDAQSAIHSLAEGDATSAMMDVMLKDDGRTALDIPDRLIGFQVEGAVTLSPSGPKVPDILKRSVVAPYIDGVLLVHRLRRRGGWAAVDALWKDPPGTTEQLLHADKLQSREPALDVPIPGPPPFCRGTAIYHDVLGEQSIRLLFEEWLARSDAVDAASGWGGDRVAVYRCGQRLAVVWHLAYDDEPSASRALAALVQGAFSKLEAGVEGGTRLEGGHRARRHACRERQALGPFAVARDGVDVAVVLGPYEKRPGKPRRAASCEAALRHARSVAGGSRNSRH